MTYQKHFFIPIFVIRRTSGSPFLGGGNADFPFSGFAGFNPFDIFGQVIGTLGIYQTWCNHKPSEHYHRQVQ